MGCAQDMLECEVEEKDACNPMIDSCVGLDVRVVEHAFDILRVNFDDEVTDAYNPETCCMQASKEAVRLKLRL